ncbi:MAG: sodium:alanine symporter family protein [FCB group bacterium]|nr:sodium:alanine symporter family protein [FCB group bacterium]
MIILLLGTGLFVSFRLGWIQLRQIKHAIDITRGKYDDPKHAGDISHFQALSAALSATIGIGNIAGVATAIHFGGPGALFWMWLTGILGTSLKYAECTLSMKYRKINPDGSASGGPMYYMEKALGWKWLAVIFAGAAAICALGTGNGIQAFTMADQFHSDFNIPVWLTGGIIAMVVASVILGGIKRIGRVTSILAPLMTVIYVVGTLTIILLNLDKIPGAFSQIINGAFSPAGVVGGATGATFMHTLIWGIKRGLFSNEAGQGSAPIAHAAAKTDEPVREGTVAMLGPYIDTLTICTLTGLCILVTDAWIVKVGGAALNGSPMTAYAFREGLSFLGGYGGYVVTAAVLLFATSTIISWSYYGDRSIQYLFGDGAVKPYRIVYCMMIFVGAISGLEEIWTFGDVALGVMAIPNLIALIALSGVTARLTKEYYSREHTPFK